MGLTNLAFLIVSLQHGAKEYGGTTEIELNELLKRFVVRQVKAARRSAVPGPEPASSQKLRSWRPASWLALRLAAMPDYFVQFFRS
jgi:hypothetical protein